jgi:hypothetical protein
MLINLVSGFVAPSLLERALGLAGAVSDAICRRQFLLGAPAGQFTRFVQTDDIAHAPSMSENTDSV